MEYVLQTRLIQNGKWHSWDSCGGSTFALHNFDLFENLPVIDSITSYE